MELLLRIALVIGTIVILNRIFQRRRRRHARGDLSGAQRALYSLPTICERLPAVVEDRVKPSASDCTVWDDFWLQIEFVSRADADHVESLLEEISVCKEQHRDGSGFRELHVRQDHPTPIEHQRLSAGDVKAALLHPEQGRLFLKPGGGSPTQVDGGFAFVLEGIGFLYGYEAGGVIQAMGIQPKRSGTPADEAWQRLRTLTKRYNLILVDWLRGEKVTPEG